MKIPAKLWVDEDRYTCLARGCGTAAIKNIINIDIVGTVVKCGHCQTIIGTVCDEIAYLQKVDETWGD